MNKEILKENILKRYSTVSIPNKKVIKNEEKILETKSPICAILGHVDSGKTSLIKSLNFTVNETGGITQKIQHQFVSQKILIEKTSNLKNFLKLKDINYNGILFIDTPGHEIFSHIRSNSVSNANFAILMIDINDELKPQTLESIQYIKQNKLPMVIALNKIDQTYQWQVNKDLPFKATLNKQTNLSQEILLDRINTLKELLKEVDIKSELYLNNKNMEKIYNIVPISTLTGEGISDLLALILYLSDNFLQNKLKLGKLIKLQIMDNLLHPHLGKGYSCLLINGKLKQTDILYFNQQPIKIKSIILNKENQKEVIASQYISLFIDTDLFIGSEITNNPDKVFDINNQLKDITFNSNGINLIVDSPNSLLAINHLLKLNNLSIKNYHLGNPNHSDLIKINLWEGLIISYNVQLDNINILYCDNIYHLIEIYQNKIKKIKEEEKKIKKDNHLYPFKFKLLKQYLFNIRNPMVIGVRFLGGKLTLNQDLFVIVNEKIMKIGKLIGAEKDHKPINLNKININDEFCVKIDNQDSEYYIERHYQFENVYSFLTRESIDYLKEFDRDILTKDNILLIKEIKELLNIN